MAALGTMTFRTSEVLRKRKEGGTSVRSVCINPPPRIQNFFSLHQISRLNSRQIGTRIRIDVLHCLMDVDVK
jgi:hypothetical protein